MKKKIILANFCNITVIITLILFTVIGIRLRNKAEMASNTNMTVAAPTVVIDAGHGGEDGGATGSDGTLEKNLNLAIALRLQKFYELNGYNVVMTRTEDAALSDDLSTVKERKNSDLKNRIEIFNNSINDFIISIHQNKFEQSKYYGTQIFYSTANPNSQRLADKVRESVFTLTQPDNTRVNKSDNSLYILKNCTKPVIIIECGFVSNPDELIKLKDSKYQGKLAFSILAGCLQYDAENRM